mgnify:CR=1 FL=1
MYEYKAVVDRVIDGDTVDFIVDLGFSVFLKIRGRHFIFNNVFGVRFIVRKAHNIPSIV